MNKFNFLVACFATSFLWTACDTRPDLAGKWVQPIPGQPNAKQGFVLEENGKASSVNMSTLKYETWEWEEGKLILSGESIGNHQTISFQDTLTIERLTPDSLILSKGKLTLSYVREELF